MAQSLAQIVPMLESALERLEKDEGSASDFVFIDTQLNRLRTRYRENPKEFEPHLSDLKVIRERHESWLISNSRLLVDWYYDINEQLSSLEEQKTSIRKHFIDQAKLSRATGDVVIDGARHVIRVRQILGRSVPLANSPERSELEEIITSAGRWEQVGGLNKARLQSAMKKGLFSQEQTDLIEQLCPLRPVHQVSIKPRENAE